MSNDKALTKVNKLIGGKKLSIQFYKFSSLCCQRKKKKTS